MIKNFIIGGVFCLMTAPLFGQVNMAWNLNSKDDTAVSPIVKEEIEAFAKKVNTIIKEQKSVLEKELADAKAKADANGTSISDWEKQKAEIADKNSLIIDQKIHDLGFDIDEVTQKQVRYSLLNSDSTSEEELKRKLALKYRATKSMNGYINWGVMDLTNNRPDNALDQNKGFSSNLEFGMKFNYQFGQKSPWAFISGFGFSWRTLRLDNDMFFDKDENSNLIIAKSDVALDKSKLRTGYFMIPIGFQYNFSKIKTVGDIQYRPYYDGFKMSANVYGGIKMSSNNIVKGDDIKFRNRENYEVNPFVYGAQVTFSYGQFGVFVKKDFSNFFKNQTFENDKMYQFGVSWGF